MQSQMLSLCLRRITAAPAQNCAVMGQKDKDDIEKKGILEATAMP